MTRENELLRKIEKGDASCWEELASMYYDDILRYCLYHTRNRETAEDAVQETFLKVIRYFPRYKNKGKFRAFLYKVASNTCVDSWRQNRETQLTEQIEYQEAGFAHSESEEGFQQIVGTLPKDQREVVYLRFAHDLTLREIAGALEIPMRTVQSRLRAGLKKIEERIGKEEAN